MNNRKLSTQIRTVIKIQQPKKVKLTLVGLDGNAYSLLGAFRCQARKEGWTEIEINKVMNEARTSDYNHLLRTLMAHCTDTEE